jgi:ATP-binding cassette subfamily B protein
VTDLLPFLLAGVGLTGPYVTLGQGVQVLRRARLAATHVEQILETPPLPEPRQPTVPSDHRVEFEGVSFSYDDAGEALSDIDVVCETGTLTALVGPSGSGKTTFTRLIPRFFDVETGAIRVGGVDVRDIGSQVLLSRISMVFQDVVLLRDTVRENIRLGRPEAPDGEVEAAARAARIHDVIVALPQGYDTVLGEGGGFLSGGERQRLTIARAILQDAPIVILDEATAFADPENEVQVQDALAELTRGKTVFVIAHRLHTITHADQILVLDRGRIVERGTHDTLLGEGGLYSELWAAQERVLEHSRRPKVEK